jgi:hypothetical protein
MRIEITQDISGTGDYRWKLYTGAEHIDEYEGVASSLGKVFEDIVMTETLNAQQYQEDFRPLCLELATELDKYVSMYSPEGKVLYRALHILHKPPYEKEND